VNCAICKTRKPKRYCPGVPGEICSVCCGVGREETVDCPLDCDYLREAHIHEKPPEFDRAAVPNQDIIIEEPWLEQNQHLLILFGSAVMDGAMKSPSVTDYDVREALESLIRTYRTLESGLYYEALPTNPYALEIHETVQARVADLRRRESAATGLATTIRDSMVLRAFVFLQRLEYTYNNNRKRSRAFLDFLRRFHVPLPGEEEDAPALEPDEPRIIL